MLFHAVCLGSIFDFSFFLSLMARLKITSFGLHRNQWKGTWLLFNISGGVMLTNAAAQTRLVCMAVLSVA